jgi:hypothetical protein
LNLPGAFPSQFSIAGGDPDAKVSVIDWGVFAQDDWKVSPKLTLSLGLRYENQTGVSDNGNFGPRVSFAYAPGADGKKTPKTVFRGGFGIFYERFGRNLVLQTKRFNGINQQQYIVMYLQTALSVERQLPRKTTVSFSYVNTAIRNQLRARNINAPLNGMRPDPSAGNIFQYESNGHYNQNQLIFNIRSNFSEQISIFGNYSFGAAKSDTEGAGTFPANTYDLTDEYGTSLQDIRHRFTIGGNYTAPYGLRFSPFISFRTGIPFNIVTGVDSNGDTLFTERPSFASSLSEPGVSATRFGLFDPTPEPGDTIIPRNYGRGDNYFGVNLNIGKEFGFGGGKKKGSKEDDDESPYKLEFVVQIRNLFNRTNPGTPVGNLSSTFFGQSISSAANFGGGGGGSATANNRRIRLEETPGYSPNQIIS